MGRIFSIADIHGRYDLLKQLFKLLYKYHTLDLTKDIIVFTGDYVDRGPDSAKVLKFIHKLTHDYPNNVIALLGNHEQMMIDWYEGDDRWGIWILNGGDKTMLSFKNREPRKLLKWLKSLPLFYEKDEFIFSHAPIPREEYRGRRLKSNSLLLSIGYYTREELLWSCPHGVTEEHYTTEKLKYFNKIGVCGHVHALKECKQGPRFYDNYIYGDAGCGCHSLAPLCAIDVRDRKVIYSYPKECFDYTGRFIY